MVFAVWIEEFMIGNFSPSLQVGEVEIFWLDGGRIRLDGGPMFGPVPKALWSKKVAVDENNCIAIDNSAMLVRTPAANIIIDSGIGNKMTPKQQENFNLESPWRLPEELAELGLSPEEIDIVIPTHADFDHAGGLTFRDDEGRIRPTFPRARHLFQRKEWAVVEKPDRRSATSYWPENFAALKENDLVTLIDGDFQVTPEVRVLLTGGHTIGHQAVVIESAGESAVHLGDLLPSQNHLHPLWVIAYDDYPMEVIAFKERFLPECAARKSWILFYHDTEIRAGRAQAGDRGPGIVFSATLPKGPQQS
jgi:glyoxylase-like metal-dependent hydrolase (beta-lactamase superfamily II)